MRVGLSTCGKTINEELFRNYANAGLTDMEFENGHQKYNQFDYEQVLKWAKQYGVNLWSYHLPFVPFDEILELISAHPSLRACLDTNHLLSEDIPTFIRKVGKKIITLHVSDYDFVNERHWLPGEGDVDWQALISALKEVGYNGPWNYEVHFEAPETIERRELTCSDFVENAQTLWSGKKPVAIGKRIANLG